MGTPTDGLRSRDTGLEDIVPIGRSVISRIIGLFRLFVIDDVFPKNGISAESNDPPLRGSQNSQISQELPDRDSFPEQAWKKSRSRRRTKNWIEFEQMNMLRINPISKEMVESVRYSLYSNGKEEI